MDGPVISMREVVKDYRSLRGRVRALSGLTLDIARGCVFGVLGPNGAGKTTLLKLMLGLVRLSGGEMLLFGSRSVGIGEKERIGFLPEENYLYPFLTVRETVEYTAGLYKNRSVRLRAIPEILETVGMAKFAERRISECSKGMARRTALAAALIHDPELVLLDEPTSGFDPIGIAHMKEIVHGLKRAGKTVVICSHQLADVEETCDSVLIMDRGRMLVQGRIAELLKDEEGGGSFAVPGADLARVEAWLLEQGIRHERTGARSLESFFVKTLEKCRSAS